MGRHRRGRGVAIRVHAFQREAVPVQLGQHRVTAARAATERSAFDDLGHMQAQGGRIPEHLGQGGENRAIAGAPGYQHVGLVAQRTRQRISTALAHDVAARQHLRRARLGHGPDGFQRAGAQSADGLGRRDIAGHGGEPEAQREVARDLPHQGHRGVELRSRAGRTGAADDERYAQLQRGSQHEFQVAPHHRRWSGHGARTQVVGAGIDGAHVATDEVWLARQAAPQRRQRNAVAELPGRCQHAQRPVAGPMRPKQLPNGRHRTTPSKGACCCAPYTSPSPGLPAQMRRGIENLSARMSGSRWRATASGARP